jgi:hypothetical protein
MLPRRDPLSPGCKGARSTGIEHIAGRDRMRCDGFVNLWLHVVTGARDAACNWLIRGRVAGPWAAAARKQ